MRLRPRPSGALGLLLLVSGCGGDDGGGGLPAPAEGEGEAEFTPERYCREVAGAACHLATGCNNQWLFYDRHDAPADCVAALAAQCEEEIVPVARSVVGGGLWFDNAAFRACLDELGGGACTPGADAWGLTSCYVATGGARVCDAFSFGMALSDACQGVFTGIVREGAACYSGRECAEGLYCYRRGASTCPGECRRTLDRGEECTNKGEACPPGSMCGGTAARKRCLPQALAGEECTTRSFTEGYPRKATCVAPLHCLSTGQSGDEFGRCVGAVPLGGQCGDRRAPCEPDSLCLRKSALSVEGTCVAFYEEDAVCDDSLGTPRPCGIGLNCYGPGTDPHLPGRAGSQGLCRPYPRCTEQGCQPCIRNDANCLEAYCTAGAPTFEGICAPLREPGEECSQPQQCESRTCGWTEERRTKECKPAPDPWEGACLRPPATPGGP